MTIYTRHPLSAAFPSMGDDEFSALVDDIAKNGQLEACVAIGTEILDGWHRYNACLEAGLWPRVDEFTGDDPVRFVLSKNLHRRSLTASQRAMSVVACNAWLPAGRRAVTDKGAAAAPLAAATNADMAAAADVSRRSIQQAKTVTTNATPEVKKAVLDGELSVERAAQISQLPEAEQAKALVSPPPHKAKETTEPDPEPQREAMPTSSDAHDDTDIVASLEQAHNEIAQLTELVKAAEANDAKAETLKWRRAYDAAVRSQSEAMDRAKQAADREAWTAKQLQRCGKAVNERDPTKIPAKVEALARSAAKGGA